jgi:hypothetical protein
MEDLTPLFASSTSATCRMDIKFSPEQVMAIHNFAKKSSSGWTSPQDSVSALLTHLIRLVSPTHIRHVFQVLTVSSPNYLLFSRLNGGYLLLVVQGFSRCSWKLVRSTACHISWKLHIECISEYGRLGQGTRTNFRVRRDSEAQYSTHC